MLFMRNSDIFLNNAVHSYIPEKVSYKRFYN